MSEGPESAHQENRLLLSMLFALDRWENTKSIVLFQAEKANSQFS